MARATGPIVGLDIGSAFMKAVEMTLRGGRPEITAAGLMPTPPDALVNGEVLDPPAMGAMIRHLLEISGIRSRRVVSSIAGANNVTVRIIPVPRMAAKDLADTMKYEIDRFVPFAHGQPIEKDYAILPVPADNDANMQVILTVAIQSVLNSHIQALLAAGLEPVAIEVEPLAVARSLTGFSEGARPLNETVGIINLGASSTELSVVTDGVLIFPRTISIAGDQFTRAIAENLGMRMDAAERLKRQYASIDLERIAASQSAAPEDDLGFMNFGVPDAGPSAPPPLFDFNASSPSVAPGMNPLKQPGAAPPIGGFDLPGFAPPGEDDTGAGGSVFDLGDTGEADLFPTQVSKPPSGPSPGAAPGGFDLGGFDLGGATVPGTAAAAGGFDMGTGDAGHTGGTPEEEEAYTTRQVQDIMLPVLGELITELRRSIEYYRGHNQSLPLARLLLCGGSVLLPNLAKFMESELGIPVQIASPLAPVHVNLPTAPPGWLEEVAPLLAIAVGLAEREMVALPADYVPRTLAQAPATV